MAIVRPMTQMYKWFPLVSEEDRSWAVNRLNPANPFWDFVGNDRAVYRLCRAAYGALGREDHCCADQSFALIGPASVGKTTMARKFAALLGLPFIEVEPMTVKTPLDILLKIAKVLQETTLDGGDGNIYTLELVPKAGNRSHVVVPPCVLFIDEVHNLVDAVVQGLLKATEKSDGILDTGKMTVDCRKICWVIATTDRGLLFDAFDTRFQKVQVEMYTEQEIGQIVRKKFPNWSENECKLIAKYGGRVPREVIAFAQEVRAEQEMRRGPLADAIEQVRKDNNIDEFGETQQRVNIMAALGQQGPIAKARLGTVIGVKSEELEKFILPPLLAKTADREPLVAVGPRGCYLTAAGLAELDKRGIQHLGEDALPDSVRRRGWNGHNFGGYGGNGN